MPKYFLLFIFSLFLVSCNSNSCQDFKTGNFNYPENLETDVKIERNESFQIETSKKEGYTDKYQIFWDSDCSYHLVLLETNKSFDGMKPLVDTMFVNIIELAQNSYTFKAVINKKVFEGQLIKQ